MKKITASVLAFFVSTCVFAGSNHKDNNVIANAIYEQMEKNCANYSTQMMFAVDSITASENPVTIYQNTQKFEQSIARLFEKDPAAQAVGIAVAKILIDRTSELIKSGKVATPKSEQNLEFQNRLVFQTEFLSCLSRQAKKRKITKNETCWLDEYHEYQKQNQQPVVAWLRQTTKKCDLQ